MNKEQEQIAKRVEPITHHVMEMQSSFFDRDKSFHENDAKYLYLILDLEKKAEGDLFDYIRINSMPKQAFSVGEQCQIMFELGGVEFFTESYQFGVSKYHRHGFKGAEQMPIVMVKFLPLYCNLSEDAITEFNTDQDRSTMYNPFKADYGIPKFLFLPKGDDQHCVNPYTTLGGAA